MKTALAAALVLASILVFYWAHSPEVIAAYHAHHAAAMAAHEAEVTKRDAAFNALPSAE
jgi:hypothetical protein